jgi:hypothetical protein
MQHARSASPYLDLWRPCCRYHAESSWPLVRRHAILLGTGLTRTWTAASQLRYACSHSAPNHMHSKAADQARAANTLQQFATTPQCQCLDAAQMTGCVDRSHSGTSSRCRPSSVPPHMMAASVAALQPPCPCIAVARPLSSHHQLASCGADSRAQGSILAPAHPSRQNSSLTIIATAAERPRAARGAHNHLRQAWQPSAAARAARWQSGAAYAAEGLRA